MHNIVIPSRANIRLEASCVRIPQTGSQAGRQAGRQKDRPAGRLADTDGVRWHWQVQAAGAGGRRRLAGSRRPRHPQGVVEPVRRARGHRHDPRAHHQRRLGAVPRLPGALHRLLEEGGAPAQVRSHRLQWGLTVSPTARRGFMCTPVAQL